MKQFLIGVVVSALILSGCNVGSSDTVDAGATSSTGATGTKYTGNFKGDVSGPSEIIVLSNGNFSGKVGGFTVFGNVTGATVGGAVYGGVPAELVGRLQGDTISGQLNIHQENGKDGEATFTLNKNGTGSLPTKNVVATYSGDFAGLIKGPGTIRVEVDNSFTGEFSSVQIVGRINGSSVSGLMFAPGNPTMEIFGTLNTAAGTMSGPWNIFNHNGANDGTYSLKKK